VTQPQPAGWTYAVNTTTYANTTRDVADIISLVSQASPDWTAATDIYQKGKNSFRNLTDGTPRIMEVTMARDYKTEAYFAAAKSYYGKATYASDPILNALTGTGDFAVGGKWACCGVRQGYASAIARFYGPLYWYHESDDGVLKIRGAGNYVAAYAELNDAVACLMAPRVVVRGDAFRISGRVGPGYNFWDWSAKIAKGACAARSGKADVPKQLLAIFKEAKLLVDPATVDTLAVDRDEAANAYAAKLQEASRQIAITFVRASLASAKSAAKAHKSRASAKKCSTSCGLSKMHLAQAHAYWYIAESALNTMGAPAGDLEEVRNLVDPSTAVARHSTFSDFAKAVRSVVGKTDLSYRKDVYLC